MNQLTLDFSQSLPVLNGKKTERLPIACSEEFKHALNMVAGLLSKTPSELAHRYVVEGIVRDLGNILLAQPMASLSLAEVIEKVRKG